MLLEQKLEIMERFGFALEPFGPGSYAIKSAPALLPEGDYSQVVRQMVAELADVDTSAKLRQHLEERLATIACHSVIRANRKLEPDEMRALLEAWIKSISPPSARTVARCCSSGAATSSTACSSESC